MELTNYKLTVDEQPPKGACDWHHTKITTRTDQKESKAKEHL